MLFYWLWVRAIADNLTDMKSAITQSDSRIGTISSPKKDSYTPVRYEGLKAAITGVSQKEKEYKNTPVMQSDCERLLNGGFILILVYIMYIILSCPEL